MINQPTTNKAETVDIKEYMAILLKRKWLILVCFLLSMAGATAYLFTRQPIYRANLKMLVTSSRSPLGVDITAEDQRSFWSTEITIMRSTTMMRRVMQRMKKSWQEIAEDLYYWNVSGRGGIITISVDSPNADFTKEFANAVADEYLRFRAERRAATQEDALLRLTKEINRLAQDLKAAKEKAQAFAKENNMMLMGSNESMYLARYLNAMNNMAGASAALANAQTRKQLIDAKSDAASVLAALEINEQNVGAFESLPKITLDEGVAVTNLLALGTEPVGSDTTDAFLADAMAKALTNITMGSTTAAVPAPQIGAMSTINPTAVVALTPTRGERLFELERKRRATQARLDEMLKFYKPRHPAVVEVQGQLNRVNAEIEAAIGFLRESLDAEVLLAQTRYDQAKASFDKLNVQAVGDTSRLAELRTIQEEANRVKGLYDVLIGQLMKVDVASSFGQITVSILEPAVLQGRPVTPNTKKGLMMGALFGIGLGVALAFFIEYIDDSIKLAEEVERDLQLPFLGMIPAAQWTPEDLTAHRLDRLKQQGGVSEAYRVVRSAIIFSSPREKLRTMLVSSAVPREGKTTTCVNLAIGFAQIEERVLLVDGDLRRGELHKYFSIEREKGLTDVLLGQVTIEEAVKHTDVPNLDVITAGPYPANPAELLLGWRLKEFLEWAQQHYDRIIIDCTPVMGIADSAILGSAVDGVLFVIWAGRTSRRYVRVAKMTAVSRGAKIFGFVLNNLEPGRVGYYHYYPYYYSYYSQGYYHAHQEEAETVETAEAAEVPAPISEQEEKKKEIDDVY